METRRNEFILTAKIVQAVDLQDFRRCNFEGDFFFVGGPHQLMEI
jgi:hypothetical protein